MGIFKFQNKEPKIAKTASISPDAVLIGDVTIGEQSSVWSGVVIRALDAKITIGDCTNIQENSVITTIGKQKTTIGNYVTFFPGVTITSSRIGDDVCPGHRIAGDNIGAGRQKGALTPSKLADRELRRRAEVVAQILICDRW